MVFDPQKMTDQELLDKTLDIHKRLAWASRFSSSGQLVEQLQRMAEACAFAASERAAKRAYEAMNKIRPDGELSITPEPKTNEVDKTNGGFSRISPKRDGYRSTRSSRPIKE